MCSACPRHCPAQVPASSYRDFGSSPFKGSSPPDPLPRPPESAICSARPPALPMTLQPLTQHSDPPASPTPEPAVGSQQCLVTVRVRHTNPTCTWTLSTPSPSQNPIPSLHLTGVSSVRCAPREHGAHFLWAVHPRVQTLLVRAYPV